MTNILTMESYAGFNGLEALTGFEPLSSDDLLIIQGGGVGKVVLGITGGVAGAAVGGISGALGGAAIGAAAWNPITVVAGAIIGGVAGGITGGIAGANAGINLANNLGW